ncbi:MAG: alpha/beta hydrolase [Chloroflexi bacterium]|nr:alpha/beta hydrolase [Chloroflexota bacterium]
MRVTANGIDTFYEEHGAPEGVPVLFIHGGYGGAATTLASSPHVIADALAPLGAAVRLVTYDRRSAGRTAYRHDHFQLADIAADAAALLDALGIGRAVVVGSSAGGPVALQFALTWPDRVLALALPNTGPALMSLTPQREGRPPSEEIEARLRLVRERLDLVHEAKRDGDRALFARREGEFRTPPPVTPGTEARGRALADSLAAVSTDDLFSYSLGMVRNLGAYEGIDFTDRLGELVMPVLIVHGNADRTVPIAYGKDLAAGIAQAEFHEVEGAGHGITAHPEAQHLLREWLTRVGVPASAR